MYERDMAISPEGDEIYYTIVLGGYTYSTILLTRRVDGVWTRPQVAPFATDPRYLFIEPHISPDGKRLFFVSNRPLEGEEPGGEDIWVTDRTEAGWGEPYNLGAPVNSAGSEFFPSVTRDGTVYFTRRPEGDRAEAIYRSRLVDGAYTEPERLPEQVNGAPTQFNACIAPDESYIVVCAYGREDSVGGTDYYVSFRNQDDTWVGPINLGEKINTDQRNEHSPYVTSDGALFFFMSSRTSVPPEQMSYDWLQQAKDEPGNGNPDMYWVDASVITALRPES
jgi:hypothetical protein